MANRISYYSLYALAYATRSAHNYNDFSDTLASSLGCIDGLKGAEMLMPSQLAAKMREMGADLTDGEARSRELEQAKEALEQARAAMERCDEREREVRAILEADPHESTAAAARRIVAAVPDCGPTDRDRREAAAARERLQRLILAGGKTDTGGRSLYDSAADEIVRLRAKVEEQAKSLAAIGGAEAGLRCGVRIAREHGAAEMRERAAALVRELTSPVMKVRNFGELAERIAALPLSPGGDVVTVEQQREIDRTARAAAKIERLARTKEALEAIGIDPVQAREAAFIAEEEGGAAPETAHSALLRLAKSGAFNVFDVDTFRMRLRGMVQRSATWEPTAAKISAEDSLIPGDHAAAPWRTSNPSGGLSAEDAETLRGAGFTEKSRGTWEVPATVGGLVALRWIAAGIRAEKVPAAAHGAPGRVSGAEVAAAGSSSVAEEHGATQGAPRGCVWVACGCLTTGIKGGALLCMCDRCGGLRQILPAPQEPKRDGEADASGDPVVDAIHAARVRDVQDRGGAVDTSDPTARDHQDLLAAIERLTAERDRHERRAEAFRSEYRKLADGALSRLGAERVEGLWRAAERVVRERDEARAEAAALREKLEKAQRPVGIETRAMQRSTKDLRALLESLADRSVGGDAGAAGQIEDLVDAGLRHRNANVRDAVQHWIAVARCFGFATHDGGWGELEKELTIVFKRMLLAEAKLRKRATVPPSGGPGGCEPRESEAPNPENIATAERAGETAMRIEKREDGEWLVGAGEANDCEEVPPDTDDPDDWYNVCTHHFDGQHISCGSSADGALKIDARWPIAPAQDEQRAPDDDRVTGWYCGVEVSWPRGAQPDLVALDAAWLVSAPGARQPAYTQSLHSDAAGVRLAMPKDSDPRAVLATVAELLGLPDQQDDRRRLDDVFNAAMAWSAGVDGADARLRSALAASWRIGVQQGDPAPVAPDREQLGREAHEVWREWIRTENTPNPIAWEMLTEADRELDRRRGERLFAMGVEEGERRARIAAAKALREDAATRDGLLAVERNAYQHGSDAGERRVRAEIEAEAAKLRARLGEQMGVCEVLLSDVLRKDEECSALAADAQHAHEAGLAEGERRAKAKAAELSERWRDVRRKILANVGGQSASGQDFMVGAANRAWLCIKDIRDAFGIKPTDPDQPPGGEPGPEGDADLAQAAQDLGRCKACGEPGPEGDGFPADVPPEVDEHAAEIAALVDERVTKVLEQPPADARPKLAAGQWWRDLGGFVIEMRRLKHPTADCDLAAVDSSGTMVHMRSGEEAPRGWATEPAAPPADADERSAIERAHADGVVEGLRRAELIAREIPDPDFIRRRLSDEIHWASAGGASHQPHVDRAALLALAEAWETRRDELFAKMTEAEKREDERRAQRFYGRRAELGERVRDLRRLLDAPRGPGGAKPRSPTPHEVGAARAVAMHNLVATDPAARAHLGADPAPLAMAVKALRRAFWIDTAGRLERGELEPAQAIEKVRDWIRTGDPDDGDRKAIAALEVLCAAPEPVHVGVDLAAGPATVAATVLERQPGGELRPLATFEGADADQRARDFIAVPPTRGVYSNLPAPGILTRDTVRRVQEELAARAGQPLSLQPDVVFSPPGPRIELRDGAEVTVDSTPPNDCREEGPTRGHVCTVHIDGWHVAEGARVGDASWRVLERWPIAAPRIESRDGEEWIVGMRDRGNPCGAIGPRGGVCTVHFAGYHLATGPDENGVRAVYARWPIVASKPERVEPAEEPPSDPLDSPTPPERLTVWTCGVADCDRRDAPTYRTELQGDGWCENCGRPLLRRGEVAVASAPPDDRTPEEREAGVAKMTAWLENLPPDLARFYADLKRMDPKGQAPAGRAVPTEDTHVGVDIGAGPATSAAVTGERQPDAMKVYVRPDGWFGLRPAEAAPSIDPDPPRRCERVYVLGSDRPRCMSHADGDPACGVQVRAPKPERVEPGQVWRCVGVDDVLVVIDNADGDVSLAPVEAPGITTVRAREADMLGLPEWSYVRGSR